MDPATIGLLALAGLLALIAARVPIGVSLIAVLFAGSRAIAGTRPAMWMLSAIPLTCTARWTLSSMPIFLLMG